MALPAVPPPPFDELSGEEKLHSTQALWDRIAARPDEVPVPEWHLRVIRERLEIYRSGQERSRPWPEIREELLSRLHTVRR
jgi:hypothetical protein